MCASEMEGVRKRLKGLTVFYSRKFDGKRLDELNNIIDFLYLCFVSLLIHLPYKFLPFRNFLGSLYFDPVHLWNPCFLYGGVCRTVNWSGCHHLLEKNMSFI